MLDQLTSESLYTNLMMLRDANPQCLLLVEGPNDYALFQTLVDRNKCSLVVGNGRERILEAMRIHTRRPLSGLLAVVDADFDRLLPITDWPEDVLCTDGHDLEVMTILSPSFWKFVSNWCSEEKVATFVEPGRSLQEVLLERALPISALRLHSRQGNLNLKFDKLELNDALDVSTLQVDVEHLITVVLQRSKVPLSGKEDVASSVQQILEAGVDSHQAAVGHDVTQILTCGTRKALATLTGDKRLTVGTVERALRSAFEWANFVDTRLYATIRTWEKKHLPYRVLPIVNPAT